MAPTITRSIVTFDLDSTLCDTRHRHPMIDRVNGTDWSAYSKACVNDAIIPAAERLVHLLSKTHDIHYVSGRTESARKETLDWLAAHGLPVHGLWLDDTPGEDHFAAYGGHAQYKVARVKQVEEGTGQKVLMHVDDWAEVAVALTAAGYPTICVRTPSEVEDLVNPRFDNASLA